MSRFRIFFLITAAAMTGVVIFEVLCRSLGKGSTIPDSILDVVRSGMFVLWSLGGVAAATKEVLERIDLRFAEFATREQAKEDKRKKVAVNAMMQDFGLNISPINPPGSFDHTTSPNMGRVVPFRGRRTGDAN